MGIIGILSRDFRIPLPPFSVISKINPSFFFDKGVLDSPVPLLRRVFSQPLRPSFIRRAPHPSPSLCPSQKGEDVTAPPVALNRFALRLAGHQSPRQFFVRDGTAGGRLAKTIGCAGWDRIAESFAESGGIRALARIVLAGMNPQG